MEKLKDEIASMKDELAKKNRDQLDFMYNIDFDNFSSRTKKILSEWQSESSSAFAEISAKADENSAEIESLTKWANEAQTNMASISQKADANGAEIRQIVSSVGEDGTVNAASIVAAINSSGSSVQISADHIELEGSTTFVTRDELADNDGSTTISGNHIRLDLPFVSDADSTSDEDASSMLSFTYDPEYENCEMAKIYTKFDGSGGADGETTEDSKFAMVFKTNTIRQVYDADNVESYNTAIKFSSAGNMSFECRTASGGIYMDSYGYATFGADYAVRIRAVSSYSAATDAFPAGNRDYVFASDGIYYNGKLLISTS